MPQPRTLMTTWPGPGRGSGRSTSSSLEFWHVTAFIARPRSCGQEAGVERRQRLDQRREQLAGLAGGQHVGRVKLDERVLGFIELPQVLADQAALVVVGPDHDHLETLQVPGARVGVEAGRRQLGPEPLLVAD